MTPQPSALAATARAASALAVAGGAYAVTWRDAVDGQWHTAFVDDVTGIPAATLATVAVARDGTMIEM
jgi:hydroxymethylglutaryl-CoA reductase